MPQRYVTPEQAAELEKCAGDCLYWLTKYAYLKHTSRGKIPWDKPYDYQRQLIKALEDGLDVLVLKSRRIGASWTVCAFVLWLVMFYPDITAMLLSRKESLAKGLLKRIKFILNNLPRWMRPVIGTNTLSELSFVFSFGDNIAESNIMSLTTTDESGRGEDAAFVFVDEIAFIANGDDTWAAVGPTAAGGGQRAVVSTPNGIGGIFHRLTMQLGAGQDIGITYIEAHWARDCGLSEEWFKKATVGMSLQKILQEFELQFLSTGSPFFDLVKLAQCYKPLKLFPDIEKLMVKTEYNFSGVDTSEGHSVVEGEPDYHSICVLNELGVQIHAFNSNRMARSVFTGHIDELENGEHVMVEGVPTKVHREYPGGMAIEIWGSGDVTAQMHRVPDDDSSYMIEHRQTNSSKMRILNSLRLAVNELQIALTDSFTYQCMRTFEDQTSGAVEKAGAAKGSFDDAVISLALAWMLLKRHGGQIYDFTNIRTSDGRRMIAVHPEDDLSMAELNKVIPVGQVTAGPLVDIGDGTARDRSRRMLDGYEDIRAGRSRMRTPGLR